MPVDPEATAPEETPPEENPGGEGSDFGGEISIRRVELFNLLFTAVMAALVYFLWEKSVAMAVGMGGIIMALSFRIMASVLKAVFGKGKVSFFALALFWLKFGLLMTGVGALVLVFDVDAMGLLIGLSLIVPAIVLETVLKLADTGGEAGGKGS